MVMNELKYSSITHSVMFQAAAAWIAEDYRIEKLEILREWRHNDCPTWES